jgi:hypothetical protein
MLTKGDSVMLSENQRIRVENVGDDPLSMIRMTLIESKLD